MSTLADLARAYARLQANIQGLEAQKKQLQKEFDLLRNNTLPDNMQELDIKSVRIDSLGTVALYPVLQVKQLDTEALFDKLRAMGDGDLIKPTVNSSTLRAYIKEGIEGGRFAEMDFEDILDINGFLQARLTRR